METRDGVSGGFGMLQLEQKAFPAKRQDFHDIMQIIILEERDCFATWRSISAVCYTSISVPIRRSLQLARFFPTSPVQSAHYYFLRAPKKTTNRSL